MAAWYLANLHQPLGGQREQLNIKVNGSCSHPRLTAQAFLSVATTFQGSYTSFCRSQKCSPSVERFAEEGASAAAIRCGDSAETYHSMPGGGYRAFVAERNLSA